MAINFTVYDEVTGKILRTGSAPASMVSMQAGNSERSIVGKSDDECDWVHPGSRTIKLNHITTRKALEEKREREFKEGEPARAREALIQKKMRDMAEKELIKEGVIA